MAPWSHPALQALLPRDALRRSLALLQLRGAQDLRPKPGEAPFLLNLRPKPGEASFILSPQGLSWAHPCPLICHRSFGKDLELAVTRPREGLTLELLPPSPRHSFPPQLRRQAEEVYAPFHNHFRVLSPTCGQPSRLFLFSSQRIPAFLLRQHLSRLRNGNFPSTPGLETSGVSARVLLETRSESSCRRG